MKPTRLAQWAITTVAVTLVAAACGGGADDTVATVSEQPTAQSAPAPESETNAGSGSDAPSQPSDSEPSGTEQAPAQTPPTEPAAPGEAAEESADPANNQLPDVDVVDLATGAEINLRTLAPADTPIILWFWAPH